MIAVVRVEGTSDLQCEALLQATLPALPPSADQLAAILFARPPHPMPVHQDIFNSLDASALRLLFVVDDGSAVTLARIISCQLAFTLGLGGEPDTAQNVSSSLITPLLSLDGLASESSQGFLSVRDKGDPDSTVTLLSEKSASLRPDGVIRSTDGRRLLMKWEEKADDLAGAVEDLKGAVLSVLSRHLLCMSACTGPLYSRIATYVVNHGGDTAKCVPNLLIILSACHILQCMRMVDVDVEGPC